jgi:alpha-L-fucosidase 2
MRMLLPLIAAAGSLAAEPKLEPSHSLVYDKPAAHWLEAVPVGNGRMGAMVHGGVSSDLIQFNEQTLVPGDSSTRGVRFYQPFGNLRLEFEGQEAAVPSDYRRWLDLDAAAAGATYTTGGVTFRREVFASHPDRVVVVRLSANKSGALNLRARLADFRKKPVSVTGATSVAFSGKLDNGLAYASELLAVPTDGTLKVEGDSIHLKGGTTLTLLLAAATDFESSRTKGFRSGQDPLLSVRSMLTNASSKSFADLQAAHLADHRSLYRRVNLDLETTEVSSRTTDARLAAYKNGEADPSLSALLFHYGRYLLIASSRPGGQPANLQGLWNAEAEPAWFSAYTTNINLQMNYWPAEVTALSECHQPLFDWVDKLAEVQAYSDDPRLKVPVGWVAYSTNNQYGGNTGWAIHMPGSAWLTSHFWEHYAFTGDRTFLEKRALPHLRSLAEMWIGRLVEGPDGKLITPDGWSPEHGPVRAPDGTIHLKEGDRTPQPGASYDQQIVHDLFSNFLAASKESGNVPEALVKKAEATQARLLGPRIGRWGQIMEWMEDVDNPKNQHRHNSHLFAVHPGRQISPDTTPALAEAAKVSLKARGNGGTGWSLAWKMNLWARLGEGDTALAHLNRLLQPVPASGQRGSGTYPNLFGAHPPFQMDSNFGATAGIAEMLLQSQERDAEGVHTLRLLPALPAAWSSGAVTGLRARGGFSVDLKWEKGRLAYAKITSLLGNRGRVRIGSQITPLNLPANGSIVLEP